MAFCKTSGGEATVKSFPPHPCFRKGNFTTVEKHCWLLFTKHTLLPWARIHHHYGVNCPEQKVKDDSAQTAQNLHARAVWDERSLTLSQHTHTRQWIPLSQPTFKRSNINFANLLKILPPATLTNLFWFALFYTGFCKLHLTIDEDRKSIPILIAPLKLRQEPRYAKKPLATRFCYITHNFCKIMSSSGLSQKKSMRA